MPLQLQAEECALRLLKRWIELPPPLDFIRPHSHIGRLEEVFRAEFGAPTHLPIPIAPRDRRPPLQKHGLRTFPQELWHPRHYLFCT